VVFFMVSTAMNHTSGGNPHPGLSFLQFCFVMVSIICVFFCFQIWVYKTGCILSFQLVMELL
jgi:hypothetical protein